MTVIVQKYGGTSVGTVERIKAVAARIQRTVAAGHQVVAVVSAMGHTTDELVKLAADITDNPSRREMDMLLSTGEQVSISLLSMALQAIGQPAVSMTGAQVGIVTESHHSRARILEIDPERLRRQLDSGNVVVVAGFQGIAPNQETDHFEITTLGRGGSDTSAVALAAALKAECCEIYTDVPGVLTTDPRLVPEAQIMPAITCDEMLELASLGASVLHPRAVEIARNYGVRLVVRSSWTEDPGTQVTSATVGDRPLVGMEIARPVDGVQLDADQAKVTLLHVPDRPGIAAQLFRGIGEHGVSVDLIIQSVHEGSSNDISFTVGRNDQEQAEAASRQLLSDLGGELLPGGEVAKVSVSGVGIVGRPEVLAKVFRTLADAGVNLQLISTSEVKVSCVIDAADRETAIAALCQAFEIEASAVNAAVALGSEDEPPVRGVALDRNQARLAILAVPDRPGMAARIFETLAQRQISVDMIVQSQRSRDLNGVACRDICCTLAREDAVQAQSLLEALQSELGFGAVLVQPDVAKLSIVGAGMAHQSGVAAQMFAELAAAGINIEMIATSEIKTCCVIAEDRAIEALQRIHQVFGLAGERAITVPA